MTKTSKNCLGHSKDSDGVDKDEGMVPERVCSWAFRFGLCKEDFVVGAAARCLEHKIS